MSPFRSKAHMRYMYWAESKGKLPKGTAEEWENKTKSIKSLPERVKRKIKKKKGVENKKQTQRAMADAIRKSAKK